TPCTRPSGPRATSLTSRGPGREVNTTEQWRATSTGDSAGRAPPSTSGRAASGTMSWTIMGVAGLPNIPGNRTTYSTQTNKAYHFHFAPRGQGEKSFG